MNLHAIVKNAIGAINRHEKITLYRCKGISVKKGVVLPEYEAVTFTAQIQAPTASDLTQNERLAEAVHRIKVFLDAPADTINRYSQTTEDIIRRSDGSFWLVVGTGNDFSAEGWLSVLAVLQVEPPEGVIVDEIGT